MKTSIKVAFISDDEVAIRALEDHFAAAFNAGDVDAMMQHYITTLARNVKKQ